MSCKNKVAQHIPRGYGVKTVYSPCGSTGINGELLLCDDCIAEYEKIYPQGWKHVPGDLCKHGNYVGDYSGPDYMCHICELE